MKKTIIFISFFVLLSGSLFAQISFGLSGGVGYLLKNTDNYDVPGYRVHKTGTPIFLDIGYTLPLDISELKVSFGGRCGYHNVYSVEGYVGNEVFSFSMDLSLSTLPILFFGYLEFYNVFLDVAIGVHKWDLSFNSTTNGTSTENSKDGVNFAAIVSAGYSLPITKNLDLLFFAGYINYTSEKEDSTEIEVTPAAYANIGIRLNL